MRTHELVYKGAYLSEPLNNIRGVKEGSRLWVLSVWCNGSQSSILFRDLSFWAKKEVVKQGFKN